MNAKEIREKYKQERIDYLNNKVKAIRDKIKESAEFGYNNCTWSQSDEIEDYIIEVFKKDGYTVKTSYASIMGWNCLHIEW